MACGHPPFVGGVELHWDTAPIVWRPSEFVAPLVQRFAASGAKLGLRPFLIGSEQRFAGSKLRVQCARQRFGQAGRSAVIRSARPRSFFTTKGNE